MHGSQIALDRGPVRAALQDGYGGKWRGRRGERVTRGESDPFESKIESDDGVDGVRFVGRRFARRVSYRRHRERISSMPGHETQAVNVDSHQAPRAEPPVFERQLEHNA